jgi:hypothetical protein
MPAVVGPLTAVASAPQLAVMLLGASSPRARSAHSAARSRTPDAAVEAVPAVVAAALAARAVK